MKILTVNAGSSSIKYSLFQDGTRLVKGIEERIGRPKGCKTHSLALKKILHLLVDKGFVQELSDIQAVAHRVVHGGNITDTTVITPHVLKKLKSLIELAPLHEPPEIRCIEICQRLLRAKHVAVFDTSFHTTIDEIRGTYALPLALEKKYTIKRYGFHGISHEFVAEQAAKILGKPLSTLNLVTCHLGNGASVTAVKKGKSFDTSMGFTPLEGLVMGSRCGDIDAGVLFYLMNKGYKKEKLYSLLNKESGLLGLSGHRDMRDIQFSKKPASKLALEIFCYRVAKYIGSYIAGMNGCDAIVFTAGIGEHSWKVRKKVMEYFGFLGVKIDAVKNKKNAPVISKNSKVKVLVLFTDEELMMAQETASLLKH